MGCKSCFESDNKVIKKWNKNPYSKIFFICSAAILHRLICLEVRRGVSKIKPSALAVFLRKNIELVKFIFVFSLRHFNSFAISCAMLTAAKEFIYFFCLTLHKTTLYPKTFFKTKRAMQNLLCVIVESNCKARNEVPLCLAMLKFLPKLLQR